MSSEKQIKLERMMCDGLPFHLVMPPKKKKVCVFFKQLKLLKLIFHTVDRRLWKGVIYYK